MSGHEHEWSWIWCGPLAEGLTAVRACKCGEAQRMLPTVLSTVEVAKWCNTHKCEHTDTEHKAAVSETRRKYALNWRARQRAEKGAAAEAAQEQAG